jgi:ribosomal protein S14
MDQSTNYKRTVVAVIVKSKPKRKVHEKCSECKKKKETVRESHKICRICYKTMSIFKYLNRMGV